MRKTFLAAALMCLLSIGAKAQFYTHGSDPSGIKWYSTETPYYRIIYPQGADSLARVYGRALEQFRVPIGHTIGRTPGDLPRNKKMPVILHTHNAYSNGSVAWAPRRMDLYTLPDPYGSDPTPWEIQLAAHEPRHQAQLQYGYEGVFKYFSWLIGDGFSPVTWELYLNGPIGEGDAVAAETGLASGTRTRTADFLDYFRVAYDSGDFRTWNRWRYGSFKYYTPDYYKIGYMTVAGARVFDNDPLSVKNLMDRSLKKPWKIAPQNFKVGKTFRTYAEKFNAIWQEEAAARAPFIQEERLSEKERFPVFYNYPVAVDGTFYLVRSGFTHSDELVAWRDGEWTVLKPFSSHASSLYADPVFARIYWTETIRDPRWELDGKSIVRYYDIMTDKVRDLTTKGRFYTPCPSPDGTMVVVADYPVEGGTATVVLSSKDGSIIRRYPAPAGVQVSESTWFGDDIYSLCIEDGGYSIYRVGDVWERVFEPVVAKMGGLGAGEDCLEFFSDATGVNELYRFWPSTGRMVQLTSLRHGGIDFFEEDGYLYYTSTVLDGSALKRISVNDLIEREVSPSAAHEYKVEDAITAQENALGGVDRNMAVEFTPAKRYHKLAHAMRFHTWAPLYVNYDAIENASFDFTYDDASPGATVFFQNDLGTLYGALGYAIHPDPDKDKGWRNALHAKLTYAGQYPVFEASLDFGDRAAAQYVLNEYVAFGNKALSASRRLQEHPSLLASLKAYVPLSFRKGGVLYGVTPQVKYSVSNNLFSSSTVKYKAPEHVFEKFTAHYIFNGFGEGRNYLLQSLSASLRGYVMLPRPESRVYPKLGIGAEIGGMTRLGLKDFFAPNVYAYAYSYIPGFFETHGIRATALVQKQLFDDGTLFGDVTVGMAPRGFGGDVSSTIASGDNPVQWKFTVDYAMPFTIGGDLSLMPVLYIKNFVLIPHFDYTVLQEGNLWSVGADFTAELGYVFPLAIDASAGITVDKLGGTWFTQSGQKDLWYVGPVFDFSF